MEKCKLSKEQFQGKSQEELNTERIQDAKSALLEVIHHPSYHPMKEKELAILLNIEKSDRKLLRQALAELLKENQISLSTKGKYGLQGQFTNTGIFEGTQRGFGFVRTGVEGEGDIYIAKEDTLNAFSGDLVSYTLSASADRDNRSHHGKRRGAVLTGSTRSGNSSYHATGRITKILEHNTKEIVGIVDMCRQFAFVIPDNPKINQDIFVEKAMLHGAVDGDKVLVRITEYSEVRGKNSTGEVIENLGQYDAPGTDILSVAKSYQLPMEFSEEVLMEVQNIPQQVLPGEMDGRLDLRHLMTITIDGEDAKDLDDAITLELLEDGVVRLGVHIADVSHYVKENSPLDRQALLRGTSCYLIDRVIPMLPKELSNGICSLNEGCDRLALSCMMDIDSKGQIITHQIAETVICVNHRMTYTDVNKIITNQADKTLKQQYSDILEMLMQCAGLSERIRTRRGNRGALDFDFPESKFTLDERGNVIAIKPYEQNKATRLIEDFMLCANETVAEDFFWQDSPFLYRIHPEPDTDQMMAFASFINNFGYSLHISNHTVHPKELQKLLQQLEGAPYESLISRVLLRSMKKAKYATTNSGHFGLSAQYYTHFTSPIRRYPDLQIHRIIKETLRGGLTEERRMHYYSILDAVADQTSRTEVRAAETERAVVKMKKAQYMAGRIGQRYEGVISGVTSWGFYVELKNTVEGLVRLADMADDYYVADTEKYQVTGTRTGRQYLLGQKVQIIVSDVDLYMNTVDFIIDNGR